MLHFGRQGKDGDGIVCAKQKIKAFICMIIVVLLTVCGSISMANRLEGVRKDNKLMIQYAAPLIASQVKPRYAIAMYVESEPTLVGLYSIARQAQATGMVSQDGIDVVVAYNSKSVVSHVIKEMHKDGLIHKIYPVNRDFIIKKVTNPGLWKGVFNKLFLFNLTDYDKLITLDTDVLIRLNIRHWFDYDTPSATQCGMEWNSGAMVISPNKTVFDALVDKLPHVQKVLNKTPNMTQNDTWNNGYGQQGFYSSYFTTSIDSAMRMKTMNTEDSVLISSLQKEEMHYFWYRRNHIFQTVHLTTTKPWKKETHPKGPISCQVLKEFESTTVGMERYNLTIDHLYLQNCANFSTIHNIGANYLRQNKVL